MILVDILENEYYYMNVLNYVGHVDNNIDNKKKYYI